MESNEIRIWGIHTLDDNLFLNNNIIAIGWKEMGDLKLIKNDREEFKKKYTEAYPNNKKGNIALTSGMLYRFAYEIQIGDYIVFPSKINREINIGVVTGDYRFEPNASEYVQQRKVEWKKHFPRTLFSQGALYEIGSAMTLFSVKNYADEFLAALDNNLKNSLSVRKMTVLALLLMK